ncbi:hypothetical protein NBT05_11265 [Aquimarina sp. ERC-38]|uniref:hypothetical protein n=1 Tax=Aquimarina sp. ERC-38 TaxID=2949996 RepID=UPI0022459214|nr:hypothetical protein [Aquimarina sp. ERC-38]UZO79538.1 hypothetical protein NBT05_11265 [Aquimarina sp. ERC-38]
MFQNYWILGFFIILIIACSEGDEITRDIDFEANLDSCGNNDTNDFVFYKVSDNRDELISFNFSSSTFDINTFSAEDIVINLTEQTNLLIYRKLTEGINPDTYFCSIIPPSENNVDFELKSISGAGVFQYVEVESTDTTLTFDRTLTMIGTSLNGEGISLRNEVILLGTQRLVQNK